MDDSSLLAEFRALRDERRIEHSHLVETVNKGFAEISAIYAAHELANVREFHDLRQSVAPLQATHRLAKWVVRGGLGLVFAGVVQFFFDHFPASWLKTP